MFRMRPCLSCILHQFAGHVPHALLSLLVSKAARQFRATRHALPSVHSVCLTATGTQSVVCGAVQAGGGSDRQFGLTRRLTRSILVLMNCSHTSGETEAPGGLPCKGSKPRY